MESVDTSGISHLSYSSISAYLMCGRSWKFCYIDRVPAPTSPSLLFGGAIHNTVERYIKNVTLSGDSAPLPEIWSTELEAKLNEEGDNVRWDKDTPESLHADGVRMLQAPDVVQTIGNIRALRKPGKPDEVYIEERFELNVPGVPVPVIGFIDIIAEDGVPGDFKTSSKSWSETQAQSELQPVFYLAALRQNGLVSGQELPFRHYIFVKTKQPKAQAVETRRSEGEIPFLFDLVNDVWKGISSEVFVPNPTTWKCSDKYCGYWSICRSRSLE